MPNWCSDKIVIVGKKESIDPIYESLQKLEDDHNNGFFDFWYPTPKELIESEAPVRDEDKENYFKEKYGARDWYYWRIDHWGTKWDIKDIQGLSYRQIDAVDDLYLIEFTTETPWNAPSQFFEKMSGKFPGVYFFCEFDEPGMGFAGYFECMNGQILSEVTVDSYRKAYEISDDASYYYEMALESVGDGEEIDV